MRRALLTSAYIAMPFVLGLILWVATDDESVAFLSGLLFAVLSMGIESRVAESGHRDDVFKAIGLSKKIAGKKDIENLVSSYDWLLRDGTEFEKDLATHLLVGCAFTVTNLRSGGCTIHENEVHARSIRLVKSAKNSIFATSVVENWAFWGTGGGQEYWRACLEAVQNRKVTMTRVFMPKNTSDLDDNAKNLIRAQREAGVDVRIAFTDDLERRNLRSLIVDCAIFDDRCALGLEFEPGSRSSIRCGSYCRSGTQMFQDLQAIKDKLLMEAATAATYL